MVLIGRTFGVLSALVALSLAVVAVTVGSAGAPERDVVLRRGRGTSQRLDAMDGVPHAHEVTEPDTADPGRYIEARAEGGSRDRRSGPDPVRADPSRQMGGPDVPAARLAGPAAGEPRRLPLPSTPGRAPPTA